MCHNFRIGNGTNTDASLSEKQIQGLFTLKLRESKDPLTVLHNRGLINIENCPKQIQHPHSKIDLTFYTEESHMGDLVKLFSSKHCFKNGKLVYSTTQEATPELSEEMHKFNDWWKSQSDGSLKKIERRQSLCRSIPSSNALRFSKETNADERHLQKDSTRKKDKSHSDCYTESENYSCKCPSSDPSEGSSCKTSSSQETVKSTVQYGAISRPGKDKEETLQA
ncbi:uncharacterized protein CEXT_119041 [Caerostris extrusa]|uniref:Uncharacterized protein n=1 Tax=Caerostris extrusa TaxID=172846 RepID=A0AAV4TTU2_CAEEX|nr:uncharacterized protein CEXT_119041 [Caerostris extrusa]